MSAGRYPRSCLADTDSDYLCPICHELLYVDSGASKDICFNTECPSYINRGEITRSVGEHEGSRYVEERLRQGVEDFCGFSRRFLLVRLYLDRTQLFASFLKGGGLHSNTLGAIEHLMTQLAGCTAWGSSEDEVQYRTKFSYYLHDFDMKKLVEALSSETYITNAAGNPFTVKYNAALERFRNTIGVSGRSGGENLEDLHAFSFIDKKAREGQPLHMFDFEKLYKNNAPFVVSLNHMFKDGCAVSRIHMYPSDSEGFAALLSLWKKCKPNQIGTVTRDGLRHIYDATVEKNHMRGDFARFLKDYTSGEKYAPVLVFDGEVYHFDYATLLLYLLYIFSHNQTPSGTQTEAGSVTHGKKRQEASDHFEAEVRRVLQAAGFETHPRTDGKKFKPSFDGQRREFDCVAVDRDSKVIVLVEAKYRDIPPSSMTGSTLVDHLVLDRQSGLLGQADDHHARRQFFIRNFSCMGEFGLRLDGSFLDYAIHTLLVTKHVPLISRRKSVRIVSYDEFKAIDFRGAGGEGRG